MSEQKCAVADLPAGDIDACGDCDPCIWAIAHSRAPAPAPTGDSAGLAAWIDFADNGHIRFWTADPALSESEKQAGRHLRGFTLAELVMFAALRQPPQPTGDVGELERRASKFSARWGNSNPSVATMMAAFAIEEVKSANSRSPMTSEEIEIAYKSEAVATLRELFSEIYTPEEFGMYLALPNKMLGGKSELELIHEGRADEAIRLARQLADCVYL